MSIPGSASPLLLASTAAAAGGYQISRSLRFNSADSANLSRTPAVAGNRRTWTWAAWVKRSGLGSAAQSFLCSSDSATASAGVFFGVNSGGYGGGAADALTYYEDRIGAQILTTAAVFRDVSAWYHIVVSVDTTQATSTNRVKIYINSVQQTLSGTYPVQNYDSEINRASFEHSIGKHPLSGLGWQFNGCLAECYLIDGQQLTPSSFTEVSATTGQLLPKAYSGSYGTNGFKLSFADNSSNTATTLGKDTSGNSNNWTPNNFSVVSGTGVVTTPASNAPPTVDYLVVAGGGGGSRGGGGAGGLRSTVTATGGGGTLESPLSVIASTSYTVTVGAGGAGDPSAGSTGTNGANSVFGPITSTGGGAGAQATVAPLSGGSGGGAEQGGISGAAGTANQGFAGGNGFGSGGTRGSGGGGGAGAVGVNGASAAGGAGGAGVACSITGSSVTYGGGGGAHGISSAGAGGTGGGGAGAVSGPGGAGSANTGGGGGGGGNAGGAGGSGIVIIRYANTYDDLIVGGGLTYTYANTGGYKIYSFTASATAAQSAGNDSLVDTPTSISATDTGVGGEVRGNYATINPLVKNGSQSTLSNGNLDLVSPNDGNAYGPNLATINLPAQKYYWEATVTTASAAPGNNSFAVGVSTSDETSTNPGNTATSTRWAYRADYSAGTVIGIAYDGATGKLWFASGNTWISSGNPSAGTNAYHTVNTALTVFPYFWLRDGAGISLNAGQRAFAYTAPSGFKALCDTNLGAPLVAKPNTLMDVKLYTGNGSTQTISGLNFSPDLVWIKARSAATAHLLFDQIRGATYYLSSNATDAESNSPSTTLTAFTSDGFTLGSNSSANGSSVTLAAWTWDAGTTTASNGSGSITSQVRANASAGFSVVTYTGNGTSGATVGHGLGVAPRMIIVKSRSNTMDWCVYHVNVGNTAFLKLNTTGASQSFNAWNSTSPTSTVFSIGNIGETNTSAYTYVAYCFAAVVGYSSFGSYTGNGLADGPFVYTGFRPKFVIQKKTSNLGEWIIFDSLRQSYNIQGPFLSAESSAAEITFSALDFLSNGFKIRTTNPTLNENAAISIYIAFAENPFQYARAR